MEQSYWEQFMKTGGVCDYLGYKMEEYGHGKGIDNGQEGQQSVLSAKDAVIPSESGI